MDLLIGNTETYMTIIVGMIKSHTGTLFSGDRPSGAARLLFRVEHN